MATLSVLTWIGNAFAALRGPHGAVTAAAEQAGCSRQTVYDHANKVQQAVEHAQLPGPDRAGLLEENARLRQENRQLHEQRAAAGRQPPYTILLDKQAQHHVAVVTSAMGLSFNQIEDIFAVLFRYALTRVSDGSPPQGPDRSTLARWVHHYACLAGAVLALLDPVTRGAAVILAIDEIFFHGKPVLVGVEPHSLTVLLCQRTPDRTGATWHKRLQPFTNLEQVVGDQGSGLQAGLKALNQERQQRGLPPLDVSLDIFHIEQQAQIPLNRIWRKVEKLWARAEAADVRVMEAKEGKRKGYGVKRRAAGAWRAAEAAFAWHERLHNAWGQAKQALALFRPDGQRNDRPWAQRQIQAACRVLVGPAWIKVRAMLTDERTLNFLDRMHRQVVKAVPEPRLRQALVELWRLSHHSEGNAANVALAAVQQVICAGLDKEWLVAYAGVKEVLGGVVRASSAVECINSVLRMQQARHRNVSQEMLDLKRLYWNTRPFRSGKREDRCPYQLLGVSLPTVDFWELLQRNPQKLAQELSSPQLAA
jgi:hypothetical protein